jgi:hypothetical protein
MPVWSGHWAILKLQALGCASPRAIFSLSLPTANPRDPASLPKKRNFWSPTARNLLQTPPRDAPDPRRSLAVAPLIRDKRCYGECPASVRRGSGGAMEMSRL